MSMYKNNIRQCPFKKVKYIDLDIITQTLTISTVFKHHTFNFHKQVTMSFSIFQCIQLFWEQSQMQCTFQKSHMHQTPHKQTVNSSSYGHCVVTSVLAV